MFAILEARLRSLPSVNGVYCCLSSSECIGIRTAFEGYIEQLKDDDIESVGCLTWMIKIVHLRTGDKEEPWIMV